MRCRFCEGCAHPAAGHAYSETCIACERCYREFLSFYRGRLKNPIAEASVRPPGTVIEGPWTAEDQAKREKSRERRKKNRSGQ